MKYARLVCLTAALLMMTIGCTTEFGATNDGETDAPDGMDAADTHVDTTSDPMVDTETDPTVDTTSDPTVDTTPDPTVDTTPDPTVDTTPDPVADTATDPGMDTAIDTEWDTGPDPDVMSDVPGLCLEDVTLDLTPASGEHNAWICVWDPYWDGTTEPGCPTASSEVTDCGSYGGDFGFWLVADGTYELHTNSYLTSWTHGTSAYFGMWLEGLPIDTDIEVQEQDYRVIRFRFNGDTVTINSLTWEP